MKLDVVHLNIVPFLTRLTEYLQLTYRIDLSYTQQNATMKTGYMKMVKKLLAITRVDDAFAKVRSESGHICICVITFFL